MYVRMYIHGYTLIFEGCNFYKWPKSSGLIFWIIGYYNLYFMCNAFTAQIKGSVNIAKLSANLAVRHLDVALPSMLATHYYILKIVFCLLITPLLPIAFI